MPQIQLIVNQKYRSYVPRPNKEDYEGLKKSISENGYFPEYPIIANESNEILDGYTRYQICQELGIEPKIEVKKFKDKYEEATFVIDINLSRRHLNDFQKAEIGMKLLGIEKERAKERQEEHGYTAPGKHSASNDAKCLDEGRATAQVAQKVHLSTKTFERAKKVIEEGSEENKEAARKGTPINKVYRIVCDAAKAKEKEEAIAKSDIKAEIELYKGDFRELIKKLPANSIDLILTDPPYGKEFLPLWVDLAREGKRVLKEGGFLIAYSGQVDLTIKLNAIEKYLSYYWLGWLHHKGGVGQRFEVNMFNRGKPILFFYKEPMKKQERWIEDEIESENADKDFHEWGQNSKPFEKLITAFTSEGATILEPMAGGGATIEAGILLKRKIIVFEIDEKMYSLLKKRFSL